MRFNLWSILVLVILGYTYPSGAQEYSSLGKSLYSSKLYSDKLYQTGIKKGRIPLGIEHYSGLLYERGTATISGGTYTYTTTDYITAGKLYSGTPTFRPWLGQSLYKAIEKEDKEDKPQYYYSPIMERKDEYYYYYSNIFYKEGKMQPEQPEINVKDKEINPFLRR